MVEARKAVLEDKELWVGNVIESVSPKAYWQQATEQRKLETKDLPPPTPEPVFDAGITTKILDNYVEKVTPELLDKLKENKEKLAHLEPFDNQPVWLTEPFDNQPAWLTALLEFEEQCRLDKSINEIEHELLFSIPKVIVGDAREFFLKQYPGLEFLCDECFLDKAKLIDARRNKEAAGTAAFKKNLPRDVLKAVEAYEELAATERQYWAVKDSLPRLWRMKEIIDAATTLGDDMFMYFHGDSFYEFHQIDPMFGFGQAFCRDHKMPRASTYIATMRERIKEKINGVNQIIKNYIAAVDLKHRIELVLYLSLKEHNIVPPTGQILQLYQRFETARKCFETPAEELEYLQNKHK